VPFSLIRRDGTFPVAGCSDWWFGASPLGGPNAGSPAAEQHLGECARTISSRDYASPGRFVFWRGARRSMVTSWARLLSCMLSSTRSCLRVRMPISSSPSTRPQGSARSSSLVSPAVTFIGPYTVCARAPNFLLIFDIGRKANREGRQATGECNKKKLKRHPVNTVRMQFATEAPRQGLPDFLYGCVSCANINREFAS